MSIPLDFYMMWDRSLPNYWKWVNQKKIMINFKEAKRMNKKEIDYLPDNVEVFCDSGGFKYMEKDSVDLDYKKVTQIQGKFEKAVTLDHPISKDVSDKENKKRQDWTIKTSLNQLDYVEKEGFDTELYLSVQGWNKDSLERCINKYEEVGVKRFALGGVSKIARNSQEKITELIKHVESLIPNSAKLHILGLNSYQIIKETYQDINSIDSSHPFFGSAMSNEVMFLKDGDIKSRRAFLHNKEAYTPPLEKEEVEKWDCNCPACSLDKEKVTVRTDSYSVRIRSIHNLFIVRRFLRNLNR